MGFHPARAQPVRRLLVRISRTRDCTALSDTAELCAHAACPTQEDCKMRVRLLVISRLSVRGC